MQGQLRQRKHLFVDHERVFAEILSELGGPLTAELNLNHEAPDLIQLAQEHWQNAVSNFLEQADRTFKRAEQRARDVIN